MSPYQNCIRDIDKRIEEVRNKLATETDVKKRDELEIKNKDLINQRESECSERSDWWKIELGYNYVDQDHNHWRVIPNRNLVRNKTMEG